jgi:hypothetical protein
LALANNEAASAESASIEPPWVMTLAMCNYPYANCY